MGYEGFYCIMCMSTLTLEPCWTTMVGTQIWEHARDASHQVEGCNLQGSLGSEWDFKISSTAMFMSKRLACKVQMRNALVLANYWDLNDKDPLFCWMARIEFTLRMSELLLVQLCQLAWQQLAKQKSATKQYVCGQNNHISGLPICATLISVITSFGAFFSKQASTMEVEHKPQSGSLDLWLSPCMCITIISLPVLFNVLPSFPD